MVLVEASSSDIGAYARLDYYRQVLTQLREHAAVKDRLVNIALSAKPTRNMRDVAEWLDIRDAVQYALQRLQVRAVVIDEAQHLMQVETYHKPVEQLNWLKNMTNQTNVLHILVGTYDLFDFRNLDAQAARRGRDLHFPRYHLETMTERREFVGALRSLLEHVPLACEMDDLLAHWRWFGELSIGCIGVLSDWMVDTVATLFPAPVPPDRFSGPSRPSNAALLTRPDACAWKWMHAPGNTRSRREMPPVSSNCKSYWENLQESEQPLSQVEQAVKPSLSHSPNRGRSTSHPYRPEDA